MYRYWDGSGWTQSLSTSPTGDGSTPLAAPGTSSGGWPLKTRQATATAERPARGRPSAKGIGWWLLILVIVGAVIFGATQVLRAAGIDPLNPAPVNPTINPCPPQPNGIETPTAHPADGRVHGGKLSYPQLDSPWSAPSGDNRLPFGRDVSTQEVMVQENFRTTNGRTESWVASVLVGELLAGDGFFSPKEGAELVAQCAIKSFYSDAVVQRADKVSKATKVSGYDAWLLETHLTFDIPGLDVKGETAIFVVVQIDSISSSVYYASIPDNVPDLLATARQVQTQLRVDP